MSENDPKETKRQIAALENRLGALTARTDQIDSGLEELWAKSLRQDRNMLVVLSALAVISFVLRKKLAETVG